MSYVPVSVIAGLRRCTCHSTRRLASYPEIPFPEFAGIGLRIRRCARKQRHNEQRGYTSTLRMHSEHGLFRIGLRSIQNTDLAADSNFCSAKCALAAPAANRSLQVRLLAEQSGQFVAGLRGGRVHAHAARPSECTCTKMSCICTTG